MVPRLALPRSPRRPRLALRSGWQLAGEISLRRGPEGPLFHRVL